MQPGPIDPFLRSLVDASPDWVFAKDLEFRFVYVNDAFASAVGLRPDDLLGRPDTDFWPLEQCEGDLVSGRRGFHDDDREAFGGHMVHNPNDPARISTGETRVFDTIKAPLRDASGAIVGVWSISRDVTEQRRAEQAARDGEARYRGLFDQLVVGVAEVDSGSGQILAANRRLCDLSGWSELELIDRGGERLTHPDDLARDLEGVTSVVSSRAGTWIGEVRMACADGTWRWVRLTFRPLEASSPPHHLLVVEDLADRKRTEAELHAREEELRRAHKLEAVGRLAGGVAHDFNNLLTVVLALLGELGNRVTHDAVAAGLVREVEEASVRAADLTRQLLTFARRQPGTPVVVPMDRFLSDLRPLLARMVGETRGGPALRVSVEAGTHPVVVDRSQLEQTLVNLVLNARDANATEIVVTARGDGSSVVMDVVDDGVGMDEAVRAHLFEPFFTTKGPGRGTGLGLATAHGIVTQAGGTIEVDSEAGRGTRFRLRLPAVTEGTAGSSTIEDPAAPMVAATVLVVEDEPQVRRIVCRALTGAGYAVLEAEDGPTALSVSAPYDLVITDVSMPGMSGPELVRELRVRGRSEPVLYMSGFTGEYRWSDPLQPLLAKPFLPADLLRAVVTTLRSS